MVDTGALGMQTNDHETKRNPDSFVDSEPPMALDKFTVYPRDIDLPEINARTRMDFEPGDDGQQALPFFGQPQPHAAAF